MRFQVPQFIEVEDKIFGPFTLKQFIYLAGGAGIAIGSFALIPSKIIAFIVALPFVGLALAFAFYKKDGVNFVTLLEAAFQFFTKGRLYVWRKVPKKIEHEEDEVEDQTSTLVPRLSDSKLKELAWSLDIHDNASERAHQAEQAAKQQQTTSLHLTQ